VALYTVSVDVDPAVAKLDAVALAARAALRGTIISLTQALADAVRIKLGGVTLHVMSGALLGSIRSSLIENPSVITGRVYSQGLIYAPVHEYGGRGFYPIVPVRARMLSFIWHGVRVYRMRVNHPPAKQRSYLRSSLEDMREEIVAKLTAAAKAGAASAGTSTPPTTP